MALRVVLGVVEAGAEVVLHQTQPHLHHLHRAHHLTSHPPTRDPIPARVPNLKTTTTTLSTWDTPRLTTATTIPSSGPFHVTGINKMIPSTLRIPSPPLPCPARIQTRTKKTSWLDWSWTAMETGPLRARQCRWKSMIGSMRSPGPMKN